MTTPFQRALLVQAGSKDFLNAILRSLGQALDDGARVLELTLVIGDAAVDVEAVAAIIADSRVDAPSRKDLVRLVRETAERRDR